MYEITLLSSFHLQQGECNTRNLFSIIENIKPDVIFEELPQDVFNIVYSSNHIPQSLEATTIKFYLKKYKILHFPVDTLEKNADEFFNSYELIIKESEEYSNIFQRHINLISLYGYKYLNSSECVQMIKKIQDLELSILKKINISQLLNQYLSDVELDDKREQVMISNIYKLSEKNPYKKAVFICGAQHRNKLIQKIEEVQKYEQIKLNWIFEFNSAST